MKETADGQPPSLTSQLVHLDPCADGIRPHVCLRHFPRWDPNGPKAMALRASLQTSGLCQPVQMTGRQEIVDPDSFERWRAAKMLQLRAIPALIIPEELAHYAFVSALFHRHHLTLGARVFLVLSLHPQLVLESEERRRRNFANSLDILEGHSVPIERSFLSVAAYLKTGYSTVKKAAELLRLFDKYADREFEFTVRGGADDGARVSMTLRDYFLPKLLEEEEGDEHSENRMGLGAILKAIGYLTSRSAHQTPHLKQMDLLFVNGLDAIAVRAERIGDIAAVRALARAWAREQPPARCESLAGIYSDLAAACRQRARAAAQEREAA